MIRYIPKAYSLKVKSNEADAVAHIDAKHLCFMGFYGNQSKPVVHYQYRTKETMEKGLKEFFASRVAYNARQAKYKAERLAFVHDLKVGEILVSSWGYDQTNIDFYQVTELVGKKNVMLRPISSMSVDNDGAGYMSDYVYPVRNEFTGKAFKKLVKEGNLIKLTSYSSAGRWNYDKCLTTSYA
jgi:hypothetical protein